MARINLEYFQREAEPPKRRPAKKPAYISWLHTLPCSVTGANEVQAAHVSYPMPWYGHYGRARGTKAPDMFAVPLSATEHARQHSMSEQAYWEGTGIDPHLLALTLFGIYSNYDEHEATKRATSRILSGMASRGRLPKNKDEV